MIFTFVLLKQVTHGILLLGGDKNHRLISHTVRDNPFIRGKND